jgi:hypothetical protein
MISNAATVTAAKIAHALDGFDIDTADAIACQAKTSADLCLTHGWDPAGDAYAIDAMPGDAQALADLLGRKLSREETRALEMCIRHHIAAATTVAA